MSLTEKTNIYNAKISQYIPFIEFRLVCVILILIISSLSSSSSAHTTKNFSFYAINEHNVNDSITGIGVSILHSINNTPLGFSIDTSLSNADVIDVNGVEQSYLAWEVGAKFGYFSQVFLYAEIGFDFGEFAFQDRDEESKTYHEQSYDNSTKNRNDYYNGYGVNISPTVDDYSNDIDAYVGLGTGIDFGHIQLSAFARYRQIDGEFWKANNQTFTGIKASLSF